MNLNDNVLVLELLRYVDGRQNVGVNTENAEVTKGAS